MQMSREGLLQTLLYTLTQQILEQGSDPQVLERLFADRWNEFEAFGGGRSPIRWPELKRTFELLIADTSKHFFLAIDGLDEFDGDKPEIADFVIQTAERGNVKICAASRPWHVFEDKFHKRPCLLLEDLTRNDIRNYVKAKFHEDRHFLRLLKQDECGALGLERDILKKASGVFLWVYLVVDRLLQGISAADKMSELQAALDDLPERLEDLFDKLLNKFEPEYHRQACELILLIDVQSSSTLLQLYYADDEDTQSAMSAKIAPLTPDEIGYRVEHMTRRLKSRCKGFLEVYEHTGTEHEPSLRIGERMKVGFLHRTARDYLREDRIKAQLLDAVRHTSFNASERWANAHLWSLKTLEPKANNKIGTNPSFGVRRWYAWDPITWCVEYALKLQYEDGKVRMTYLDEVGRVGFRKLQDAWNTGSVVAPRAFGSLLELATFLNYEEYPCTKINTLCAADAKSLLKISSERTDVSGWLDGRMLLLQKQIQRKKESQTLNVVSETLLYRSKSATRRRFSSKPKEMALPYV